MTDTRYLWFKFLFCALFLSFATVLILNGHNFSAGLCFLTSLLIVGSKRGGNED